MDRGSCRVRAHPRGRGRRRAAVVAAALMLGGTGGCASAEQPDVARVAALFDDGAAAAGQRCAVLAPAALAALEHQEGQPCAQVLPTIPLGGGAVRSVQVWGEDAQVRLGGDTLFLTRGPGGWLVTGAGCVPQGEAPYLCEVSTP